MTKFIWLWKMIHLLWGNTMNRLDVKTTESLVVSNVFDKILHLERYACPSCEDEPILVANDITDTFNIQLKVK